MPITKWYAESWHRRFISADVAKLEYLSWVLLSRCYLVTFSRDIKHKIGVLEKGIYRRSSLEENWP